MAIPNLPEFYKGIVLFNNAPLSVEGAEVYATIASRPDKVVGPPMPITEDGSYTNLVVQGIDPGTEIAFHLRLLNGQEFTSELTDIYNPGQIHRDGFVLPFEGGIDEGEGDEGEEDDEPPSTPPIGLCGRLDDIVDNLDMLIADLMEVRLFMKERVEGVNRSI